MKQPTVTGISGKQASLPTLQRKCACGNGAAGLTGQCSECERKKGVGVQTKLAISSFVDPLEHEAERTAEQVVRMRGDAHELSQKQRPVLSGFVDARSEGVAAQAPASVQRTLQSAGEPLPS